MKFAHIFIKAIKATKVYLILWNDLARNKKYGEISELFGASLYQYLRSAHSQRIIFL